MKISCSIAALFLLMSAGCAKPPAELWETGNSENGRTVTGPFVRVQSSYGDMVQAEAMVLSWVEEGRREPPFERRMTPFDIPISGQAMEIQFRSPNKGPSLKVLYVDASGKMVDYVQSTQVCIIAQSEVTLRDCKVGLR